MLGESPFFNGSIGHRFIEYCKHDQKPSHRDCMQDKSILKGQDYGHDVISRHVRGRGATKSFLIFNQRSLERRR